MRRREVCADIIPTAAQMKTLNQDTNLTKARRGTHGVVVSFMRGLDLSGSIQGADGVGGVLAVKAGNSAQCGAMTNTTHFTCYDGNGNVTALVNAADGAVAGQYGFDAFGNPLRVTGPLRFPPAGAAQRRTDRTFWSGCSGAGLPRRSPRPVSPSSSRAIPAPV